MINKFVGASLFLCFAVNAPSFAQERALTLEEAIKLGLDNSKQLRLSKTRIDEAVAQYNQVRDRALPTASASFAYNHAEILNDKFKLGVNEPLDLPARSDAYIGTVSLQQLVFQGNKLKFAKLSTELLTDVSRLDVERNKQEITYHIINGYFNLYKVIQSQKVVEQNLNVIERQIRQSQRFFEQGLITQNEVLRFQLQKSNIQLTALDLENNRKIVNYNLDLLLGLPETANIEIAELPGLSSLNSGLDSYVDTALAAREELKQINLKTQVAEFNIKSTRADLLPTLGVGANLYYINPGGEFIPSANRFLAPVTVGATVSWNIGNLWTNKNKLAEANIQKNETLISRGILEDQVKSEVNTDYQNYIKAVQRIGILQTSIAQAQENDRILESKYKNNIASVTDRIDANTQLFQSEINLEIAKADAMLAYYTLLKSTGNLKQY